ncbi:MAG: alternative ribosome rescue aminoacyl-tRNA hydrolase ArfB [Pseudomonadota bacterium]
MSYDIPEHALEERFVHASGPGGQHVNKTATAVELRVDIDALGLLPGHRRRLLDNHRKRISKDGVLIIQASENRSQLKNREAALQRLQEMLTATAHPPKRRIATRPSSAARRRRMDNKRQRGQVKATRRKPRLD